jgi:hypothetical protein
MRWTSRSTRRSKTGDKQMTSRNMKMTMKHFETIRFHEIIQVLVLLFFVQGATANEYFVATTGSDGNDGLSQSGAFSTVSNAVAHSVDGDFITILNGTYTISEQVSITNAVTLRSLGDGVYGGTDNAALTIIDANKKCRVIGISHTNTVLNGLTIRNGLVGGEHGAGIDMTGGTIINCIITDNTTGRNGMGGGIRISASGTISNCVIHANLAGENAGKGGGIYANGADIGILNSTISENISNGNDQSAGGVYLTGGASMANCLVNGNSARNNGGGIALDGGSSVKSCTVVNNRASGNSFSSGIHISNGTVENSIIYFNAPGLADINTESGISYSCAAELTQGVDGNTAYQPYFADYDNGDYRLSTQSPCINTGNNDAIYGTTDLEGNARIFGDTTDMGAYEVQFGALACSLTTDDRSVAIQSNAVLTVTVHGDNTDITNYEWSFGDGTVQSGADLATVTKAYDTAGIFTISVEVTNAEGDTAAATNQNYVTVWNRCAYVSAQSPTPEPPYLSWETAAHFISDAAHSAPGGSEIIITNGIYSTQREIVIDRPLKLRGFCDGVYGSLNNATNIIVNANLRFRVFSLRHDDVVLEGLTITKGKAVHGAGINMTGGAILNCIVTANAGERNGAGGGIYMTGFSTVSNCIVRANTADVNSARGGGIYAAGENTRILNSIIAENRSNGNNQNAGGAHLDNGALMANCLITDNTSRDGGGIVLTSGSVINCTVTTNSAWSGYAVYKSGGTITNSIIYFNTGNANINTESGVSYSCAPELTSELDGNITADPLFINPEVGDWRLSFKEQRSPCIDSGDSDSMEWTTDLAGNPRIQNKEIDMGAYESLWTPAGAVVIIR